MQRARGACKLEDFLGDAVHIDGERNAAEANQRHAKVFLAQRLISSACPTHGFATIMQGESSDRKRFAPSFHHGCCIDPDRLETFALEGLEDLLAMRAIACLYGDVELRTLRRHVEEQAAVFDSENISAELSQPGGNVAEHARLVGYRQAEGDDAILALEFAHHDRGEDARVDIAATQDEPDLPAAEFFRLDQHGSKPGGTRAF